MRLTDSSHICDTVNFFFVLAVISGCLNPVDLPSARDARLNGHPIPHFDILDLASDLDNCAGALMAQHDGAVQDKVADAATLPVVNVATANTGLLNMDAHIVLVPQLWYLSVFKRDGLDRLQNKRRILIPVSIVLIAEDD